MMYTYKYPRPALTADVVATCEGRVLLVRRGGEPFRGCWALPGGFMEMDETLEECAVREFEEETGLVVPKEELSLLGVFSRPDRDPRGRTVTAVFCCQVGSAAQVQAGDDAAAVDWWPLESLPQLAFDHAEVMDAFFRSRAK